MGGTGEPIGIAAPWTSIFRKMCLVPPILYTIGGGGDLIIILLDPIGEKKKKNFAVLVYGHAYIIWSYY